MVKKALIGIGLLGLIAFLFLRNKGGDIISKNNVFEKMEFPKINFNFLTIPKSEPIQDPNIILAQRETITQLQNIQESKHTKIESLRLATPLVVKEIYESRNLGWRNDRIIKVVANEKEIEDSLRLLNTHKAIINWNIRDLNIISNDIRQLQKEVNSI